MSKFKVMRDLVEGESMIATIFMNNIHNTKWFDTMLERRKSMTEKEIEEETVKIELTVNGEKLVNIDDVFEEFEKQMDGLIKREATKLVKEQTSEKFQDISNRITDFQEITEQWADDINWSYNFNTKNFQK